MHFYRKYEKVLAKHGYTIDEWGCVWDAEGNQAAVEDRFGNVSCADANITDICTKAEQTKKKPKKLELVEDGD